MKKKLGVNVDHIATIRQARGTRYPDPILAAQLAELGGARQITIHLREDRRHIQERDLCLARETVQTELNLEMAAVPEMVALALKYKPDSATLVPEKRQELTTEGGLDVVGQEAALAKVVGSLKAGGVRVSMFIEASREQVEASGRIGADAVELHTGRYAEHYPATRDLDRLAEAAAAAAGRGLYVAAGHGLDYVNILPVLELPEIVEFNIGHSIVARAMFVGLEAAVREMVRLIEARA